MLKRFFHFFQSFIPSKHISSSNCSFSIDDACNIVRSGDLVLISENEMSSRLVTTFCASQWSHVGIIYRPLDTDDEEPLLFEAVRVPDQLDVITKNYSGGVRLINFRNFLNTFKGNTVCIRLLGTSQKLDVSFKLEEHMTNIIHRMIDTYHGKPYEDRWMEFFFAWGSVIYNRCETVDSFFCSELVAWCYINAGIFNPQCKPASSFLPHCFSDTGSVTVIYPIVLPFPGLFIDQENDPIIKFSKEYYIDTNLKSKKCNMILRFEN